MYNEQLILVDADASLDKLSGPDAIKKDWITPSLCDSVSLFQGCPSAAIYNVSEIQVKVSACFKNTQMYCSNVTLIEMKQLL